MPRKSNTPAGWTEEQETCIKDCVENGTSWAESPLFDTSQHRTYAKQRRWFYKRRSLSPKPSKETSIMPPKVDSDIAGLASKMKDLFKEIDKRHVHQLFPGSDNHDDILLGLAEGLKLNSGTTISAAVLAHPMKSFFYHAYGTAAKLMDFLTAKTNESSGGQKTHAIKIDMPTLLNILTAEHGMDASKPNQTNSDKITIEMGTAAGSAQEAMVNCCGMMFNDLKKLGEKKTELYILPSATDLGAKPGNVEKSKELCYSTAHFNNTDGSLKLTPIKLKINKSVGNDTISDVMLVYGYIIPIDGTENNINIKSPTATTNDNEFANLFSG